MPVNKGARFLPRMVRPVSLNPKGFLLRKTIRKLSAASVARKISQRGKLGILLGSSVIAADYAFNELRGSIVGILDLMIIFLGTAIASYGFKTLKFFWAPVA